MQELGRVAWAGDKSGGVGIRVLRNWLGVGWRGAKLGRDWVVR